jgi:hypothetical protein
METDRMSLDPLVNQGVILRRGSAPETAPGGGRTFIISGIGRGGTTMVAAVLREAGMALGDSLAELVLEDMEMLYVLRSNDAVLLDRQIARRNAQYADWGFKLPNIHSHLRYSDLERFRNPHLILIFRDPVAISVRAVISDFYEALDVLRNTTAALDGLVAFLNHTRCPALLLSYEKTLGFPDGFIDAMAAFCGLTVDADTRRRLLQQMRPNSSVYARGTMSVFNGNIETVRDDTLFGWCAEANVLAPVELDLLINERPVLAFKADRFRSDLVAAGFGNGNHGFSVALTRFAPTPDDRLAIQVHGRNFLLPNSGRRLAEYRQTGD